ncbi:hypothetical protein BDA96_01G180500 [Sorghum bicolor]|uniref:Uncharacterized protein n=1 Tax=Sorghum bicolor TaxID=4558 RepID=A0A921RY90_SORBI|nr:hypothetical protein BDA96_01G180500 [Sorghum bicolor]
MRRVDPSFPHGILLPGRSSIGRTKVAVQVDERSHRQRVIEVRTLIYCFAMGLLCRRHGFVPAAATVSHGFSLVAGGLCLRSAAAWEVLSALSMADWKRRPQPVGRRSAMARKV